MAFRGFDVRRSYVVYVLCGSKKTSFKQTDDAESSKAASKQCLKMDTVYLEVYERDGLVFNLESLIIAFVFKICDSENVTLKLRVLTSEVEIPNFKLDLDDVSYEVLTEDKIPSIAKLCKWPVIVVGSTVVAGLCSVARQIIKSSQNSGVRNLLGFRESCLVACNETSTWTKFCEVDIINTVKSVIKCSSDYFFDQKVHIPRDVTRFEYHMAQPVKMHNIYKAAREMNNDKGITSSIPIGKLNLQHAFSEGPFMTLSDVVLLPCFKIIFQIYSAPVFKEKLPLCFLWLSNMLLQNLPKLDFILLHSVDYTFEDSFEVIETEVPKFSLYSSDTTRYKPQNRIYTKQFDIENSLTVVEQLSVEISNKQIPFAEEVPFDWSKIPMLINPLGGSLPKKRADRKCEQLENLSKPVIKLAKPGDRIVDFCSGSGHLGLLLAVCLPNCTVILVENKERSLVRAKERIGSLNLKNVILLQCNLDYFKASFDIGVSLHACGVATDLVIQNCIENRAHFVCCPCCYGGIQNCYHLTYPRSKTFVNSALKYVEYLNLAHAADQTHDNNNAKTKQGYHCMDVVDTDRKLQAIEKGYEVHLGKLQPVTCTPKNNLLVGILNSKK